MRRLGPFGASSRVFPETIWRMLQRLLPAWEGEQRNVVTAEDEIGSGGIPFVHLLVGKQEMPMLAGI